MCCPHAADIVGAAAEVGHNHLYFTALSMNTQMSIGKLYGCLGKPPGPILEKLCRPLAADIVGALAAAMRNSAHEELSISAAWILQDVAKRLVAAPTEVRATCAKSPLSHRH